MTLLLAAYPAPASYVQAIRGGAYVRTVFFPTRGGERARRLPRYIRARAKASQP
jgi:hypothetical protein